MTTRGREIRAFAPATVGNVACGFDVFGLALEAPGDEVTACLDEGPGVHLGRIEGDGGRLPTEPHRNVATVAARALVDRHAPGAGVRIDLRKGLPLSGGLGGSAASAVAAVVAVDALLQARLPREALLALALAGEEAAAGSPHPDNAAACLYGGWVLVRPDDPPEVVPLPVPAGLTVAVVHPHLELPTGESRRLLGLTVPLDRAVAQWGATAAAVAGLYSGDLDLVARSLVDFVAEPARAPRVPGFDAVRRAALEAGALACSLSGAGPSVFALFRSPEVARSGVGPMREAFRREGGLESDPFVSPVALRGARVVAIEGRA